MLVCLIVCVNPAGICPDLFQDCLILCLLVVEIKKDFYLIVSHLDP